MRYVVFVGRRNTILKKFGCPGTLPIINNVLNDKLFNLDEFFTTGTKYEVNQSLNIETAIQDFLLGFQITGSFRFNAFGFFA